MAVETQVTCAEMAAPGSVALLFLQLMNVTMQKCEMKDFNDLHLDQMIGNLNTANACWQSSILSKIEEGGQRNLEQVKFYLQDHNPVITDLKFELSQEKLRSADLLLKFKEEQQLSRDLEWRLKKEQAHNAEKKEECELPQQWQQQVWKFVPQKTAEVALLGATKNGDLSLTQFLLEVGTNPNALNENGGTPLHVAAEPGNFKVIQSLLKHGAFLNTKDKWGWTPLHYCAWKGQFEACKIIIDAGASIDPTTNDGRTPLQKAITEGFIEISKLLIEKGANVNARDSWQWTPLFYTAWKGQLNACALLVDNGAQLNAYSGNKDWKGTPLTYAVKYNHNDVVEYLKSKGAK